MCNDLLEAVLNHDCNLIRQLSKQDGFSINSTDKDGWTALHHLAASYEDDQNSAVIVMDLLLKLGAKPSQQDNNGKTPSHLAVESKNYTIANFIKLYTDDLRHKQDLGVKAGTQTIVRDFMRIDSLRNCAEITYPINRRLASIF